MSHYNLHSRPLSSAPSVGAGQSHEIPKFGGSDRRMRFSSWFLESLENPPTTAVVSGERACRKLARQLQRGGEVSPQCMKRSFFVRLTNQSEQSSMPFLIMGYLWIDPATVSPCLSRPYGPPASSFVRGDGWAFFVSVVHQPRIGATGKERSRALPAKGVSFLVSLCIFRFRHLFDFI